VHFIHHRCRLGPRPTANEREGVKDLFTQESDGIESLEILTHSLAAVEQSTRNVARPRVCFGAREEEAGDVKKREQKFPSIGQVQDRTTKQSTLARASSISSLAEGRGTLKPECGKKNRN
jgi:hypothetical protein